LSYTAAGRDGTRTVSMYKESQTETVCNNKV
jgi:hypothetical protein